jgi:hypothetical protein
MRADAPIRLHKTLSLMQFPHQPFDCRVTNRLYRPNDPKLNLSRSRLARHASCSRRAHIAGSPPPRSYTKDQLDESSGADREANTGQPRDHSEAAEEMHGDEQDRCIKDWHVQATSSMTTASADENTSKIIAAAHATLASSHHPSRGAGHSSVLALVRQRASTHGAPERTPYLRVRDGSARESDSLSRIHSVMRGA